MPCNVDGRINVLLSFHQVFFFPGSMLVGGRCVGLSGGGTWPWVLDVCWWERVLLGLGG
jgi:hypothetical protein